MRRLGYVQDVRRIGVLASGSGTILRAMLDADLPIAVVLVDRPCGALGVAEAAGVPVELVERTSFGADFDRVAYTHEVVDALGRHEVDLVAMAGFGTILEKPIHDAFPDRIVNTHPALLPAFKGWHAVDDALAAGVKVTGCTVHLAHARGRRRPDPGPGGGAGAPRRHRRDAARADQGSRAAALPRSAADAGARTRTMMPRALLSVYDKTGVVEFARGLRRARRGSWCRRAAPPRRSPRPASR